MDDNLRKPNHMDGVATYAPLEEQLHRGLALPVNTLDFVNKNGFSLKELVVSWFHQIRNLPLQIDVVFLITDYQFNVIDALNHSQQFNDLPITPGTSWSRTSLGSNAVVRCMEMESVQYTNALEHEHPDLKKVHTLAMPLYSSYGSFIGTLGLIVPSSLGISEGISFLQAFALSLHTNSLLIAERTHSERLSQQRERRDNEVKKRDVLLEATKKLHAKIDVDSVLTEVIDNIQQVFPKIQVDLLLSQDSHSTNLPVKPLNFQNLEDDLCTRAFMEGHLLFEASSDSSLPSFGRIAAPLSGKQGVYGVLYLQSDQERLDALDIEFISMLADTAGSAFENAKLYEQSNLLINELRLINEITKRLNQSLRLNEIFNFASSELLSIFGADYCCILQTNKEEERLVVQASNLPAMFSEEFELDEGFSGVVYATKEPVIISDYKNNSKVKSKLMDLTNSRSLIASPITVNGEVVGVILVVHSKSNFFSYDNYKLLQVLSGHIGLAMTNASLHAEVKRMVITDNLTGLYVRHYLDEQVNLMQKKDYCGSIIIVDIDNFKRVNDTYGHQIGDTILIEVSNIIKSAIREGDVAARWGGEELAIYLPQIAKDQTLRIAERIRQRIMNETQPQVTVSCGLADWNWEEEKISVESLFYKADMALYQAKNNGRNQVKVG
ncbi:Response regulator PleD [compost metagenome]